MIDLRNSTYTVGVKRRSIGFLVLSSAAIMGVVGATNWPAEASTHTANSRTANSKGLSFYRGKTITLIQPGGIGGTFDSEAIIIAPYLAQYLHATVNIQSITTGNTIPGQDALAAASPDGLTIGMLNPLNDASLVLTNTPGLNFNPAREAYVASNASTAYVFVSSPSSPYTSFASVKNSTSPLSMITVTSGSSYTMQRTLMGVLGINIHWITGYANIPALTSGFLRGDAPLVMTALTTLGPLIANGQARALAVNVMPPPGTLYRNDLSGIPTIVQLLKKYPARTKLQKTQQTALLAMDALLGQPLAAPSAIASFS